MRKRCVLSRFAKQRLSQQHNKLYPIVEEPIHYLASDFKVRQLTQDDLSQLSAFTCGVEELDSFFRYEIESCIKYHYLSGFCAYSDKEGILAAFTLMNDALMIGGESEKKEFIDDLKWETSNDIVDFFNRQSSYPAINIGHLGIACLHQSHGIGRAILDLVAYTFANYRQAGCQFITVDALNNPRAIQFYLNNFFSFQTTRDMWRSTRRMYRIL